MSHRLRCMQRSDGTSVSVVEDELPAFHLDDPLPSPAEQADRLILWIGDHQPTQEAAAEIQDQTLSAVIGTAITPNSNGLSWLLMQEEVTRFLEHRGTLGEPVRLSLTFDGWRRYETLKRAQIESRTAFMAMKFGDPDLDRVVADHFKPAVKAAGFKLRPLTDGQPAGLIDDQLRVALRTSRFVIADLTHANNGAYWEAGFAEGLGRPVIYTCRNEEWKAGKSHFDTSHLNTIIWDPEKLQDAATRLTAMIRATLPAEAKMTD
jgi:hypothetical protein